MKASNAKLSYLRSEVLLEHGEYIVDYTFRIVVREGLLRALEHEADCILLLA